ncbi:hypothetical protein ACPPVQ_17870 [Diaminobutyricibacter sp. McL0618]|uniref:hypothetical protein n=1 Tax=Leifsonia sp. McL0618 TaxID=3415677 RepID=UPI003CE6F104
MTRDVMRALGRRWYVLVAGLLMTVGLAYGAYQITPPNYTASGLVLLLPSTSAVGKGGNPFLVLSDLDQPAGILVAYFSGSTAAADVKANAPTAKFQVLISQSTRGPIIEVDVTDKTSAGAIGALDYITTQIPVELNKLQTQVDAAADARISSMPLTVDARAKADYSGTIRMVISAAVVGLLITGVIAFALDGLLLSRRARRHARAAAAERVTAVPADPEEPSPATRSGSKVLLPEAVDTASTAEERRPENSGNTASDDPVSDDPVPGNPVSDDTVPGDPVSDEPVSQFTGPVSAVTGRET